MVRTEILVQLFFCLNVVLLELIAEFFESFEVFDGDSHFLDFLHVSTMLRLLGSKRKKNSNLAKHKIAFSKLNQHFLRGESVVKLQFEILYLLFSISELYQSGLVLSYVWRRSDQDSGSGMDKTLRIVKTCYIPLHLRNPLPLFVICFL